MVSWAHPSLHPKRHLDRFSRFCTAHRRVSHYFTLGRYVFAQIAPFLGASFTQPEEDRETAIGNMHKKLVELAHVVPEISSRTDRQTHTLMRLLQYFAIAPAGVVIKSIIFDG